MLGEGIVSKFDKFLEELNVKDKDDAGPEVEPVLANGVNKMFAGGMEHELFRQRSDSIKRPANCVGITPVKVDNIVWNLLKPQTRKVDERLQVVQNAMVKSACNLTMVVDRLQNDLLSASREEASAAVEQLTALSMSSLAMLGHGYHSLCLRRRELQKPDVAWKYANLFASDVEHNQWLYGGNNNVEKMVKDIGTTNQVASQLRTPGGRGGNSQYNSGGYSGGYYPQRGNFGPMRRGFARPSRFSRPYPIRGRGAMMRGQRRGGRAKKFENRGEVSVKIDRANKTVIESTDTHFQAGRLKQFVNQWQKITSDDEILQTVAGLTIEFSQAPPVQFSKPISRFSAKQSDIIDGEIAMLLQKQVLEIASPETEEYISTIFLVPKKNGSYRLILNLKKFNEHVEYFHFKMETFDMAIKLISENCCMASIDLKDAYYGVSVHEQFRKYLRFIWNDTLYQFTCLPNGLSCAPRKYTKLMKPVYSTLRKAGISVSGFLDDLLIVGRTADETRASVGHVVQVLQDLGFVINYEKSKLEPCTRLKHLGFLIDSDSMTVSLPVDKVDSVKTLCNNMLRQDVDTIRSVAKVIGTIVACFPAVRVGTLHYRILECEKDEALKSSKGDFDAMMTISGAMKKELSWWVENVSSQNKPIIERSPDIRITSDASLEGWGGTCGKEKTGGRWDEEEQKNHINYLELLGAFFVLKSFEKELTGMHVHCWLDNTTAIAYLNHMGGRQSLLNNLAFEIWSWALSREMWLTAGHVPGVQNIEADFESRHFNDRSEWSLNSHVFEKLQDIFGKPDIDLFASRLNTKCNRYVSWQRDPKAEFIDAFSQSWSGFHAYIFPPFSLIGRILQKLQHERARATVVVPFWTTQPWFTTFVDMLTSSPILLPQSDRLLVLEYSDNLHPLRKRLRLIAGQLSGKPTESLTYQSEPLGPYVLPRNYP